MVSVSGEHYFSQNPESALRTTSLQLTLRGHQVTLRSASGTFSPGSLDAGSAVLLKYAPQVPAEGTFLDIGCGWGPLAISLALEAPDAAVVGVDVNDRALETARANAEHLGLTNTHFSQPEGVDPALSFDLIWSNPPIRVGKAELHQILATWLPRLSPKGQAWLVVAKHLGADSLITWLNSGEPGDFDAERVETSKGYRLIRVTKSLPLS